MSLLAKMNVTEFATFLRQEMSAEKLLTLDFYYITPIIDSWWEYEDQSQCIFILKS